MKAEFKTITPKLAEQWLQLNIHNRTKRGWWVSALSQMIKRGEWITSHQGIAFSKSGSLIDGQHRLEAIVDADQPVELLVVTGVSDDAYKVLDNGIKRTLSDLTGINQKTAEVSRVLARLVYGGNTITSADQCIEIYNTGVGEVHDNLIEFCGKNIAVYSSAPVRTAATCMILDGVSQNYVKNMYSNLVHQRFNDLPNIGQAFIRQVTEKKATAGNKTDLLARSLKLFNPDFSNVNRLQINDSEGAAATAYCRNVVRNILNKGETNVTV
jgi:hypothetical protein